MIQEGQMTFIEIDYAPTDEQETVGATSQTVRCSWCGELIALNGDELALAMCKSCYQGMLAEFLREQQTNQTPTHPSDR
jgi:formylmethanofuran dehydrogenase subunit E